MKDTAWSKAGIIVAGALAFAAGLSPAAQGGERKGWPRGVSITGSNLGSAHYAFATGWAKILTDKLGVQSTVEATPGPAPNVRLVHTKQTDLGLVTMAVAYEGFHGQGWAKGQRFDAIRTLAPMFPSYLQFWVLAKTPIHSIHDMTGYDVALSGAGSTPDIYGRRMFEMFGIKPKRIINAGFGDMNNQMRDGQLHVSAAFAGIPHPAVVEMGTTHNIRLIGIAGKDADPFIAKFPFFSKDAIPAKTYKEQDKPIDTLTIWNVIVAHQEAPEEFIYEVVRATFEGHRDLVTAFKGAQDTQPENIRHATLPLHPGAYRYYQERKIAVPAQAMPPELKR
jgi:TRAP transporter TAXI family solute receptor